MPALFLLGLFKDPSPRRMASQMPPTQTDNRGSFYPMSLHISRERRNHLEGACCLLYEGFSWMLQHVSTTAVGNLGQPVKGAVSVVAPPDLVRCVCGGGQPWLHGSVTLSVPGASSFLSQGPETVRSYHLQFIQRSKQRQSPPAP